MAVYVMLAAAIGGAVLLVAGHPVADVAMVGGAAVILVIVLMLIARRVSRPVPADEHPPAAPSPNEHVNTAEETVDTPDPPLPPYQLPRRERRG